MINFLPQAEKQKFILEKRKKLVTVLGIVVLVSLISLTLVLLSIKFYVMAETDSQQIILRQVKQQYQTPDFINLNTVIKKYNGTLTQLDSFYNKEVYFNQALKIISDVLTPNGLYLTNFLLNRDQSGNIQASISGISATRDNLLDYKQNIDGDKEIKNPSFSPDSWIKPLNANFSLTFGISHD